jgi:acyl carrier protein
MDIIGLLTGFVTEELLDAEERVGANEDLLADEMVDSLGMMRLVAYIEQEFGYKVPPGDLVIENFRTIGLISDYLERSLGKAEKDPDCV